MSEAEPGSSYDSMIVVGLGLLTLEFSRLEAAVMDVAAMLVTPHQFVGQMALVGNPISRNIERGLALTEARVDHEGLRVRLDTWFRDARDVAEQRNAAVHSRWLVLAVTVSPSVKKGRLDHRFRYPQPSEIVELARRAWGLHLVGTQLLGELARAGFADVAYVDEHGQRIAPAKVDFRIGSEGYEQLGEGRLPPWEGDSILDTMPA